MLTRLEALGAWLCTGLGAALLLVGALVVPADAFAQTASCNCPCMGDACYGPGASQEKCFACFAACCDSVGGNCYPNCCAFYCGSDAVCQARCEAAAQPKTKCLVSSDKCAPISKQPMCVENEKAQACYKEGDTTADGLGNNYKIQDPCNVKTDSNNCADCECRRVIVNNRSLGCSCLQK